MTFREQQAHPEALREALDRLEALKPAYSRAVQRIIARGSTISFDLLVRPVDVARERAVRVLADYEAGEATEQEAIDAHNAFARLCEMVVGEGR